jgi:hypothetical protein
MQPQGLKPWLECVGQLVSLWPQTQSQANVTRFIWSDQLAVVLAVCVSHQCESLSTLQPNIPCLRVFLASSNDWSSCGFTFLTDHHITRKALVARRKCLKELAHSRRGTCQFQLSTECPSKADAVDPKGAGSLRHSPSLSVSEADPGWMLMSSSWHRSNSSLLCPLSNVLDLGSGEATFAATFF